MLNKLLDWLKARWEWGKGCCPACHRKFYGRPELYNYDCEVCEGGTNDLTIWSKWRKWKPKEEAEAIVEKE